MVYRDTEIGKTQEFGKKLKDVRHRSGLSLAELAIILEVTPGALSRWENGTRNPRPLHLQSIRSWLEQVD